MKFKPAAKSGHQRNQERPLPVAVPDLDSLKLQSPWPGIRLLPGRDHISRSFHPWVFSGAILDEIAAIGTAPAGSLPAVVKVYATDGSFVAWAQSNPASKIRLRLIEWEELIIPDQSWLAATLRAAFQRRVGMHGEASSTTAIRLVFSEADHLPGLIIERMDRWLVVQSESSCVDSWIGLITEILPAIASEFIPEITGIIERSDGDGRKLENLPSHHGLLWGSAPDGPVSVQERGLHLWADLMGQKTGFYTDQRENRCLVADYAKGKKVLDVCCYSGAFSLHARRKGATALTLLDASNDALGLARRNLQDEPNVEYIQGDAFQTLRRLRDDGRTGEWDMIILDPPKLAPSRNSLERALAAYKDLNLQALRLLTPGGLLASFSCSGLVSAEDLRQAIAFAAKDLGRQVHILHHLHQAPCHPVLLSFPEGQYLKGFLLRVL